MYYYKVPDGSRRYRHTGADSSRDTGKQEQIVAGDSGIQEQIVAADSGIQEQIVAGDSGI
jgi:hypothetical protein